MQLQRAATQLVQHAAPWKRHAATSAPRRLPILPLLLAVVLLQLQAGDATRPWHFWDNFHGQPRATLSTTKSPHPLHPECPAWLRDYIEFHKTMKYHPDAKYLMYDCSGNGGCMGLADRLRGIMWMLRCAAHSQRVLLVRMTVPVPIETFFVPTWIDWRLGAVAGSNKTLEPPPQNTMPSITEWPKDSDTAIFSAFLKDPNHKWIGGHTNTVEFWNLPTTHPAEIFSRNASCLSQALFQPTEETENFVLRHFASMQVSPARPYIAIHLRTFQMVGEGEKQVHTLEAEERILTTLMCAHDMAPKCHVDLSYNPAVLITDGLHIRRRVSLQLYNHLTTAPIQPHHFETSGKGGEEGHDRHMETVADMIVMARASGLFFDKNSGFSRMAAYLGGHVNRDNNPCLVENHECSKWHKLLDYHEPVPLPGEEPQRRKMF